MVDSFKEQFETKTAWEFGGESDDITSTDSLGNDLPERSSFLGTSEIEAESLWQIGPQLSMNYF